VLKQWEVMRELRKRIKKTFDEEGIEIPWLHIKFGESPATDVLSKLEAQLSAGSKTKRRGGRTPTGVERCFVS